MMQRFGKILAAIVLLGGLAYDNPAMAQDPHAGGAGVGGGHVGGHGGGHFGGMHGYGYRYRYAPYWGWGYPYDWWPYYYPYEEQPAVGQYCVTPQRSCVLSSPTYVGTSCACENRQGRAYGHVEP